jgi:tRNA threonylcarbamoyladenosine biosynthesis protein TsaB
MPRPPVLLALDTATSVCSVAIAAEGTIHALARDVGQRHTEHVLSMVDEALAARSLSLGQCDAIAFGAGPGSFTGLRIACGIAQGLAYGIDRPVIPIGNLAAIALDAFDSRPDVRVVLVAQDARMNEAYCAIYSRGSAQPPDSVRLDELMPPSLVAPGDLVAVAKRHHADAIAGSGLIAFGKELQAFAGARIGDAAGQARAIVRLALDAFRASAMVDAASAAPIYVRDRVALTVEERRAGGLPLAQAGA